MAFNFGGSPGFPTANTSASSNAFGLGGSTSTAANKTGFGSSNFMFGSAASTTAGFGMGGSTGTGFSGLTSSAPTGNTGFGSLTSTAPAGNTGFGGLASSAPAGNTGFGSLVSSAPAGSTGFGGLASSAPGVNTGFGSFSSSFGVPTATTTTLTSGTPFGTTSTGFPSFSTASTSSTQSAFGGFNSFSQPATSSAPGSLFSGFAPATNTAFGQQATNFGFGTKPAQTLTSGGFSTFGQAPTLQTQQQVVPPQNPNEALYNSIFHCTVYGDERDTILSRWNLLQALWGSGKAYYAQNAPPVEITQQNPFCRFKAVGYSCIPASENKDGLVAIIFNKCEAAVTAEQPQLLASLTSVLGNKPSLVVTVESIKAMSEAKSQVVLYVQEKGATGVVRRIPVAELIAYLLQSIQKQQLASLGAENVYPHSTLDKETIRAYLDNPPAGIDPRLWKHAELDNPDPSKYLPVPMVGFGEVRWRMRCQEQEAKLHQAFLDRVADDIGQLRVQQANSAAKLAEYRRKFVELQHRTLQVLVRQEVRRKVGMAMQPGEDVLRSQLEGLEAQLSAPTQFKGRLNEMLSQMRMQRQEAAHYEVERYSMDPTVQENIKQFLTLEQNAMAHLIDTVQADLACLKIIKDGMTRLLQGH